MRIAVLSDIHDSIWKLETALAAVRTCDEMICCGDLCSPFIVDELAGAFTRPVHIVFGNNDADLFRITAKTKNYPNVHIYGELCELERAGRRIAVNHFHYIGVPLAKSGLYDVVCFGHNHVPEITQYGKTLALNPGSILGASFTSGRREDTRSSFLILDVERLVPYGYEFAGPGATVTEATFASAA